MALGPHCSFVPPYLLERIAASGSAAADHCRSTLATDDVFRAGRQGPAPEPAAPTATSAAWVVHTAAHGSTLPGAVVRTAGEAASGDVAVDEAATGITATLDLFSDAFARSSYDDRGAEVVLTVHYERNYDNAFWNGTQLVFGDGDGTIFGSFTGPIDVPSPVAVPPSVGATRRRRQAILASVASVAVALALIAYVLYQQGFKASLSQNALREIVADRTKAPTSPAPGLDSLRRAAGSISPASSAESSVNPPSSDLPSRTRAIDAGAAKAPQDGDNGRGRVADEVPGATGAAPERITPVTPAGTPAPACSGPAFALGLCDADSSSTRRQ